MKTEILCDLLPPCESLCREVEPPDAGVEVWKKQNRDLRLSGCQSMAVCSK
jgi:hypothetical protein